MINSFFSVRPLSSWIILRSKRNILRILLRSTLCKSATASIPIILSSLERSKSPKKPLCFPFKSAENTATFFKSRKKGLKRSLVKTVSLTSGYCFVKARNTGTVMATSPIAERRMTRICVGNLAIAYMRLASLNLKVSCLYSDKLGNHAGIHFIFVREE